MPAGRPMKYKPFIEILEDDQLYTPATITHFGIGRGLVDSRLKGEALKAQKLRIRHALGRFSIYHRFPKKGDGLVEIPGHPPLRAWWGKRWKAALNRK